MTPRASLVAACVVVVAGCGGAQTRSAADLEAQVRQLRQEQERQARQIEVLENRVVLAEDSARQARQAVLGASRRTVRIAPEGHAADDAIPSAQAPQVVADEPEGDAADGNEGNDGPRPVVRASGRDGAAGNGAQPPIVVRDDDRLPVVPVAPQVLPGGNVRNPNVQRGPRAQDQGNGDGNGVAPARPVVPANPRGPAPDSALPAAQQPLALTADAPAAALGVALAQPDVAAPRPRVDAAGARVGISSVRDPRAAPAYDQALALARGGQCPAAVDAFSAFLVRWPDHPFADNAMYWRGECILASGDARRAAAEFEGLLARFPVGNKAPDALYKLVVCYRRLGDEARAQGYAARLLRDYPQSPVAARLRAERNP